METKQIKYNVTLKHRSKRDIKYIVIHDTGNTAKGADADRHYSFFDGGNRNSSADIFVDGHKALKVNDYYTGYTWHCGDGKGRYGITNANSIGVELCINCDGDYDRAMENMTEVVRQLMAELDIDADHVVRHYDASRKNCPQSMNNGTWVKWYEWKERLGEDMAKITDLENRVEKLENKMVYNYVDNNMPEWARPSIQKLVDKGVLKGNERGELGLTDDMLRMLVMLDRARAFEGNR